MGKTHPPTQKYKNSSQDADIYIKIGIPACIARDTVFSYLYIHINHKS